MKRNLIICLVCFLCINGFAQITVGNTTLQEREVIGNLNIPWEIKWGPDNYIWMTERPGIVSRVNPETGQKHVILDIQTDVWNSNESGLLGMEIHPDFENQPYVFLAYTYLNSGAKEKIVAYEYDIENDELINELVLVDGIDGSSTHIGCRLMALEDQTMLITTGDAQEWMLSQDLNELTGKTLRININSIDGTMGEVPSDNPIPGSIIWSWGHRNAQGLALGPNNIIYSSEHGPSNDDELNILQAGMNYGWPNVQGYCDNMWVDLYYAEDLTNNFTETDYCDENNIVDAIWSSGSSTIAPADIIWYNHPAIPEFENTLLMSVLKDKMLVRFEFSEDGQTIINETEYFDNQWGRLRDICVSPDGKIYLATSGYSWPSQPPNEIIELYNADYNVNIEDIKNQSSKKVKQYFDLLGNVITYPTKNGIYLILYDDGSVEKQIK